MQSFLHKKNAFLLLASLLVLVPLISQAAITPLVPDCGTNCGWLQLVQLGKNLLNFMIYMAVPIAAICFAWAGWLYLSARGNASQITKAHDIFLNVAIGLLIVLVAWLVVDQIMKALIPNASSYIPVLLNQP